MAANAKAIAASPLTGGQPFVTANTISGAIGVATSVAATAKALGALGWVVVKVEEAVQRCQTEEEEEHQVLM